MYKLLIVLVFVATALIGVLIYNISDFIQAKQCYNQDLSNLSKYCEELLVQQD